MSTPGRGLSFLNRSGEAPDIPKQGPINGHDADEIADDPAMPYAMIGRGRSVLAFDFIWPDGRREGFQYSQLMRRELHSNSMIVLHVADFEPLKVTISGRNLEALADLIRDQRCCKIRIASRDFGQDDKPVVTVVKIDAVDENPKVRAGGNP